jgi:iron complex transport system ATP-binding protein
VRVWEYTLQGRYPYNRRMHFESAEDCEWASRALEDVGASHLSSRWLSQLSGGEKQRVVLARALAQQPTLLLLDEPTQHLDISARVELMRTLWRLSRGSNRTVVIVTHELNLAAGFCDQVALLHHGKFLGSGTPRQIYQREILEEAFEAPLEVQWSADGMPRVVIHNRPDVDLAGIAGKERVAKSGEGSLRAT